MSITKAKERKRQIAKIEDEIFKKRNGNYKKPKSNAFEINNFLNKKAAKANHVG